MAETKKISLGELVKKLLESATTPTDDKGALLVKIEEDLNWYAMNCTGLIQKLQHILSVDEKVISLPPGFETSLNDAIESLSDAQLDIKEAHKIFKSHMS